MPPCCNTSRNSLSECGFKHLRISIALSSAKRSSWLLKYDCDHQQLRKQLSAAESDYSLIINSADPIDGPLSHEYSSVMGVRVLKPSKKTPFISTNFYQHSNWTGLIPEPTDLETWFGVTRQSNMMSLLYKSSNHTVQSLQNAMDKELLLGGAKWLNTIYQMIFDPVNLHLSMRSIARKNWVDLRFEQMD